MEHHGTGADPQLVAVAQHAPRDRPAVEQSTVAAAEVLDLGDSAFDDQARVTARHLGVIENHVVTGHAAERQAVAHLDLGAIDKGEVSFHRLAGKSRAPQDSIPKPMSAAISVRQLTVTFPGRFRRPPVTALRALDLDVEAGAILAVLGPNGSGKTTLLRVLAGLQTPASGAVELLGQPDPGTTLRRQVAYQPEGELPLPVLTGREFLQWHGARLGLRNTDSDRRAAGWLERFELGQAQDRRLRSYSTGMQKRLALAAALLGEPDILLLDEPTSGLDPIGSATVIEVLHERVAAGGTVLLASHHLQEVEQICSEVLVLYQGQCRARGTLDELLGTDLRSLVLRGVDDATLRDIGETVQHSGGEVVRTERLHEHLFALFRRLAKRDGQREDPQ